MQKKTVRRTQFNILRKGALFILLFLTTQYAFASKKDTTRNPLRLKGIDISFGGIVYNYGNRTGINFLKAMTPNENKNDYIFDKGVSINTSTRPIKIGLNLVFGENNRRSSFLFHKSEYLFKFAFETRQVIDSFKNIVDVKYYQSPVNISRTQASYTYQTQTLGLGYQFSSKSFLTNFAFFGGISSDFGVLVLKQISIYPFNLQNKPNNFYSTILRFNSNLGVKYNYSCDINFFVQAEFGLINYGKEINSFGQYGGASFGIRYKFLEDQDKLNYKSNGFW